MPVEGVSTFQERLQTFKDAHPVKRRASTTKKRAPATLKWPHKTPTGHDLAQAGFYFHPSSSSPDNVRCFSCEVNLDGWEAEDDPILEHYAHRSDCAWATCRYVKRKFESAEFIEEDPMSEVYANARKATFEAWPHESKRGWKCKIEKMVEAGWHFDPSPDMEDGVTCAYCSTELGGWERKDDPFEEHLKRGINCSFFALCDQFASNRPTKPKRARTSKVSRASTQSRISAINDQVTLADLDTSLDITDNNNDDTIMSTTTTSKAPKGKKKTAARNTKSKVQKEAALDESSLANAEENDLGLSTMSQPSKPKRTRKKAAESDSLLEASEVGESLSQPKRKGRTKKVNAEVDSIQADTIDAQASKPIKQTRRKASKQINTQSHTDLVDAQAPVQSVRGPSSQELQVETVIEPVVEPVQATTSKKGKKQNSKITETTDSTSPKSSVTAKKSSQQPRGTKRTSEGEIKSQAPQIRMSALDKLDSSVMILDEVPIIFEDSPDKEVRQTKRNSSVRQPLQELEPTAVHRVSEVSMLRSSNMHEADSSTPRMTPEPASDAASPEPPTPTPARQSLSVVKRASLMRAGMRPSATPLPNKVLKQSGRATTPMSSPQSSDAENKPPSSRPNIKGLQLKAISPLRNALQKTPMLSPSKHANVVSRIQTEHRWTPADLDMVFQTYSPLKADQGGSDKENFVPGDPSLDMDKLDATGLEQTIKAVRSTVTEEQRKMTVEQWLKFTGQEAGEKLRAECETMVTLFEREGAKAMRVLEAIKVSR